MKTLADFVSEIPPEPSNDEPALKLGNGGKPSISHVPKKKAKQRRSPREKARYHVNKIVDSGTSRKFASENDRITSLGSRRTYIDSLAVMYKTIAFGEVQKPKEIDHEFAVQYLEFRSRRVSQKTLDVDRLTLTKVFHFELPFLVSHLKTSLTSRTYTEPQLDLILEGLSIHIATSIRLCFFCGLRAHELLTILPLHERAISPTRDWWEEQFDGMPNGKIYSVVGKGGLIRPVKVPLNLIDTLESLRSKVPFSKKDRGIFYKAFYDILAGQNLSQFFSTRSEKLLGWTAGLHGLRHSYAQNRMRILLALGYPFLISLAIVSRELGHYRPEITFTYLR